MENKKSEKANLDKNKGIFFQIGIIIAMAIILITFEWTTNPNSNINDLAYINDIEFEEEMIITQREELKKPEVKQPEVLQVLDIVEDNVEVADFEFNFEVDDKTEYDFTTFEDEAEVIEEIVPFYIVEDMPQFNGGDKSEFWKYAMKNIRYPEIAAENGVQGTVYMQFTVSQSGIVKDVKVIKGVHPDLDNEAIRVIKNSPKWTPGKQRGKPVPVIIAMPMKFILQ